MNQPNFFDSNLQENSLSQEMGGDIIKEGHELVRLDASAIAARRKIHRDNTDAIQTEKDL